MYCRNCGNEVPSVNTPCTKCGFLPLNGKDYCQECGFPTKEGQMICTNCQERLKFAPAPTQTYQPNQYHQNINIQTQNPSNNDVPNTAANIAACCTTLFTGIPIVGIILYFVWKDEKPNAAKSVCMWSLAPFIVVVIIWIIFFAMGGLSYFMY